MTTVKWPDNVNKKAYGQDSSFVENREEVKYKSGRRSYYLLNSVAKKSHAVVMKFDDKKIIADGKTEFQLFLDWFENTLMSGTNAFYFPDVTLRSGVDRVYIMTSAPTYSGQSMKEVNFTIEDF